MGSSYSCWEHVSTSLYLYIRRHSSFERYITPLICHSPLGKLAPGNAEIDRVFKDMWVEAEKNRTKWGCKSQCRPLDLACVPYSILIKSYTSQISGKPSPYLISRTMKGSPLFGFHIGKISRLSRSFQPQAPTVWARMPTLGRSFRTWGSCMRHIIHPKAPGRQFMTTCHHSDLVSKYILIL